MANSLPLNTTQVDWVTGRSARPIHNGGCAADVVPFCRSGEELPPFWCGSVVDPPFCLIGSGVLLSSPEDESCHLGGEVLDDDVLSGEQSF